jgi:hypothetical protein
MDGGSVANRTVAVQLKAEIGQYVAGMSQASAATMRLGESAKTSQATASKHFDLAGKGALIMGGAIVAGLGMAVGKSMEFEKSMSAISAATGASGAAGAVPRRRDEGGRGHCFLGDGGCRRHHRDGEGWRLLCGHHGRWPDRRALAWLPPVRSTWPRPPGSPPRR